MPQALLPSVRYPVHFDRRINNDSPQNTALVFLHHATGSSYDWRDQLDLFSNEFNCIAYDRHGFGQSILDNEPLMETFPLDYYEKCVHELADLIQVLNLEKVILVGHSDGATIALLAASGQYSSMSSKKVPLTTLQFVKERTVALVAEAPHLWFDDTHLMKGFELFKSTVEKTDRFWNSTIREHKGSNELAQKVVNRWQRMWMNNEPVKKYDDRHCLDHIDCPSLLIHGLKDPFFGPDHTKHIADRIAKRNIPTQYELIADAGHTAHREAKAAYNSVVLSFLQKYRPLLRKIV